MSLKKSIINFHINSQKHKSCKIKWQKRDAVQKDIAEALQGYDSVCHPKGETLDESVRVYRVNVVTSFLKSGVPLSKVDSFRNLLEEHAFSLTGRQHLSEIIPFIHHEEIARIKKEISGKHLSVIFDGTTHVEEALAVIVRYTEDFQIKQRH